MKELFSSEIGREIFSRLERIIPTAGKGGTVALHAPEFSGNEWAYVKECIDTGWVSSLGKFVDQFEDGLADFTSAKKVVATSNGTSALALALKLCDVKNDDEVFVPCLSFVATANAVAHCGAVPHFLDVSSDTLALDAEQLEPYFHQVVERTSTGARNRLTGRRIAALVVVHIYGHPARIEGLIKLCHDYGIELIEDAAESIGSYYQGRHTGTFGRIGVLSFNGNKTITTGGGGAILTMNEELGKLAKHLTTTAKVQHPFRFYHDQVGYNLRLPNINAALGCAQLEKLPEFLQRKRFLAELYIREFDGAHFGKILREAPFCSSNYWLNTLILKDEYKGEQEKILSELNHAGLQSRPAWDLLHTLPMYNASPCMQISEGFRLYQTVINLPSGPGLAGVEPKSTRFVHGDDLKVCLTKICGWSVGKLY
jgi:perosamine synthetase